MGRLRSPGIPGGRRAFPFTELAQLIRTGGYLRRRYGYYWTKPIAAPLVVAACLVAFVWIGDTWWQLFTAAVLAVVFTQIAFLGHDAAHRQIFVSGKWNDWISIILGDLLVGMSYGWWQRKHTRHHANPNKFGADPDIELPVIAVAAETEYVPRNRVYAWIRGHQGVFFFPILLFEGLSLHASSVRRVVTPGHLDRRWTEIGFHERADHRISARRAVPPRSSHTARHPLTHRTPAASAGLGAGRVTGKQGAYIASPM